MDIREKFSEEELEEMFDEMLDETGEPARVGSLQFSPSEVLHNCDPIAYRIALDEYVDFLQESEDED